MSRRMLWFGAVAVTAITLITTAVYAVATSVGGSDESKPNIVYFLVDDMSADLLDYMDTVKGLGADGARFDDYFVSNSLCCPSRATMFTGQHPHNSGVLSNTRKDHGGYKYFKPREDDTYAKELKDLGGYRTGYMGKYINQYKMDRKYQVPEGWDEWHVANGGGYGEFDYRLSDYVADDHKRSSKGGGKYLVDVLRDRAVDFIDRSRDSGDSFFLQVAPFSPHSGKGKVRFPPAPRDQPGGEFENGDCGEVDCDEIDVEDLPGFDEAVKHGPEWLRDEPLSETEKETLLEDFRNRVRMVQSLDDMVRRVMDELTEAERANTYIMFGSDNGFHLGQHRMLRGKESAFDTDIRVPLLVKRPEGDEGGDVHVDEIAQNTDIYPTILDIANGDDPGPQDRDGRSLLGLIHDEKPEDWRDAAFIEHHTPDRPGARGDPDAENALGNSTPPPYAAMRTGKELFVDYKGQSGSEYYDLEADPGQTTNLPDDPRAEQLREKLRDLAECGQPDKPSCWEAAQL